MRGEGGESEKEGRGELASVRGEGGESGSERGRGADGGLGLSASSLRRFAPCPVPPPTCPCFLTASPDFPGGFRRAERVRGCC